MKEKRNDSIVFLRFLAIMIVMFGHSIIIYDKNWGLYFSNRNGSYLAIIKQVINVIQMPLWFYISGYLFYSTKTKSFQAVCFNKIQKLIIPFLLIGIFYMIPIRYLVHYPNYLHHTLFYNIFYCLIMGFDNGHLWYLPTLFFMFMLFYKMRKSHRFSFFIILTLTALTFFSGNFSSYIASLFQYSIFFYLGIFCHSFHFKNNWKQYFLLPYVTLLFAFPFFSFNGLYRTIMILLLQILGIVFIVKIDFTNLGKISIIQKIANASYGMYLFHSPLVYLTFHFLPNIHPILTIFINYICFGSISYLITKKIQHSKLCFIVGEKNKYPQS